MMSERQQPIPDQVSGSFPVPEKSVANNILANTDQEPQNKKSAWTKIALVAGMVVLAVAVGIERYIGTGSTSDKPTRTQIAEMDSSWRAARESGVALPAVKPEELNEAIESANIPDREKAILREEVDSGRVSLVWITVWDNLVEDGDIVSLSSDGLTVTVPLYKEPQRIAIPRPAGNVVNLTGIRDGGGGITLGLMSGPDTVLIPPLSVGQKVGIPVH